MPKDPVILLSFVNTALRDKYKSLDALCEDMGASKEEITEKLSKISYVYDEVNNRFK